MHRKLKSAYPPPHTHTENIESYTETSIDGWSVYQFGEFSKGCLQMFGNIANVAAIFFLF